MKPEISIVKIGGNVIEQTSELKSFLKRFADLAGDKILVHGGGKLATQMAEKLKVETKMLGGRRVTDKDSLEIVTMVYAGLVNKTIVAQLQASDCNAIGLCGADGNSIQAHKRKVETIDYGFVGDIDGVNTKLLTTLLSTGLTPVFCALTDDGAGQLLNTNADTIAAELAIGLSGHYQTTLYYCFEKKGVLSEVSNEDSVIEHIDSGKYKQLLEQGIIADGMIPKLENCFNALEKDVHKVCIGQSTMIENKEGLFTSITL